MRRNLLTLLASCLWVFVASAQTTQSQHAAVSGQALGIAVESVPQAPNIQRYPSNGSATFQSSGGRLGQANGDTLEYVPALGFYGSDTIVVSAWSAVPFPRPVRYQYVISVGPSIVTALDDYAETPMGQAISVAVLDNDVSTFGSVALSSINAVVGGTASIDGTVVAFTPNAGYRGAAYVTYTACDLLGVCDAAEAVLLVYDPNPTSDTLSLQVPSGGEVAVLINPQGFPLTTAPAHGSLVGTSPIRYVPDAGYVGPDSFAWTQTIGGQLYTKLVGVDVLDVPPPNQFAVDDEVYLSRNTTAFVDVLSNDVMGPSLSGFAIVQQPTNGTAVRQGSLVVYTPAAGFAGVDQFVYRVFPPGYSGPAEYATVDVYVSDLEPVRIDFDLETPKNTPLVIDYPIPIANYAFGIRSPLPLNGSAAFYTAIDSTIAGYPVVGERLLIYNPAPGFVGADQLRANYCITSTGVCVGLNLNVEVLDLDPPPSGWCVQECVWPGDTDNNGVVELADLLPIGTCHGATGLGRATSSTPRWRGLDAPNWSQPGALGEELKYVDADGDGVVAAADTLAIVANLGRYHRPYPVNVARVSGLPLYINFPFDTLYEGQLAYLEVILGTPGQYAVDAYGLTFDLNYSTAIVREGSQRLVYEQDSWLAYNTATLDLVREEQFGSVRSAFTLTDGTPRTGYGRIARFEFIVEEDVLGIRPRAVSASGATGDELVAFADFTIAGGSLSNGVDRVRLADSRVQVPVVRRSAHQPLQDRDLLVWPNPAGATTQILLNGAESIDELRVINELGQVLTSLRDVPTRYQLDVARLPSGVYVVEARSGTTTLRQSLVKR